MSVDVSLAGFGSGTPGGGATVAGFTSDPVASGEIVATRVYVAEPPERSETVEAIEPAPEAAPQLDPTEAAQVQVAEEIAGSNASETGAFVTGLGPALVTTIEYVVVPPGTTDATPSVLVIPRSACVVTVTTSVDESLAGVMSPPPETVAVFETVAGATSETDAVTAMSGHSFPAANTSTRVQVTVGAATTQPQPGPEASVGVRPAGSVSETVTRPTVGPVPTFETASVKIPVDPRKNVGGAFVFRMVRSATIWTVPPAEAVSLPAFGSSSVSADFVAVFVN